MRRGAPECGQQAQLDKFKDAPRELECDDDEQCFKERLGKLVKTPDHSHKKRNAGHGH